MNIEEMVAKLEQGQHDLKACLDMVKQSIPDQIAKLQEMTIAQLAALLEKKDGKGKVSEESLNIEEQEKAKLQDRCHLGLRLLIGSRHQSSRPQGWKSAELSSQKQDNFLTFSELQDWFHLGLRLLIGSRHQSSRPQGWKSVELSSQKHDNFLPFFRIAGPVSSWPSSVDRVKTSIFPTSRMEECRQDNFLTFLELQDRCHLGLRLLIGLRHQSSPTSRMEECRVILARAG
ncbi:hypothetical protein GQ457_15G012560 [Hibiscus cannabinus]